LHQDSLEYLSNKYESLNYDKTYNLIELNEKHTENSSVIFFEKYIFILNYNYLSNFISKFAYRKQIARWIVMLLVGFFTGLVAVVIDFLVDRISTAKYSLIVDRIIEIKIIN
jgi:hypothetical protein